MKTKILKVKGDWKEVVDDCRTTVGKDDLGHEPSKEFKKKILIAEHSPIRDIFIKWKWSAIKSWIATHFSRHKWECFIRTQRTDRTGLDRDKLPQDSLVSFTGEANIQSLIDTMRKRLCYQASKETREYAEDLKCSIYKIEPEIANVLVPNCIYRCGCPEISKCGFYQKLCMKDSMCLSTDIQERYNAYNSIFYLEHMEEQG